MIKLISNDEIYLRLMQATSIDNTDKMTFVYNVIGENVKVEDDMSELKVNLEDGDMGRAKKPSSVAEFFMSVPHVANILNSLRVDQIEKEPDSTIRHKYAYEFYVGDLQTVELVILRLQEELPIHVKFYGVEGRKLFEMRGPAGGIVSHVICYLITV